MESEVGMAGKTLQALCHDKDEASATIKKLWKDLLIYIIDFYLNNLMYESFLDRK
jgi:hypothetical protein